MTAVAIPHAFKAPPRRLDISERSRAELAPFLWGTKSDGKLFQEEAAGTLSRDPLMIGMEAVSALYGQPLSVPHQTHIRGRLDAAYAELQAPGYWPHAQYLNYPKGWWSAMDFASTALGYLALHQATGRTDDAERARYLIDRMLGPPSEHGAMWRLPSGACWLSEYTWQGQTLETEPFVLNGFLYALQILWYAAEQFNDEGYRETFACARKGLAEKARSYPYPDGSWLYYQTTPPVENPGHYAIYETVQADALFGLTGDALFRELAGERRALLQKLFPVYRVGGKLFFSRMGPPHPYVIDIYTIRIEVEDERGNRLAEFKIEDGPFFYRDIPAQAAVARVYSVSSDNSVFLYKTPLTDIEPSSAALVEVKPEPGLDAVHDGDAIVIRPDVQSYPEEANYLNHQGRINFRFSPHLNRADLYALGIEIAQAQDETMALHLFGQNHKSASRVLPRYAAARDQIIVVAPEGFRDIANIEGVIRSMSLSIDTRPDQAARPFKILGVRAFKNSYELFDYFQTHGLGATYLDQ